MQLPTVGLLVVRDRKLLLAFSRNKQCFYLPGGKIDAGESPEEALCREIAEELDVALGPADLHFHSHVTAPAYGETNGTIMEQDCYFVHKPVAPVAAAEIGELKYFTLESYLQQANTAPGVIIILERLKSEGVID